LRGHGRTSAFSPPHGSGHLRTEETYGDLTLGCDIGTTTVHRHLREALDLLAATMPSLVEVVGVKTDDLDDTLLHVDQVGMI
jgi:hypothetical protein